jgi:hypothetical protein
MRGFKSPWTLCTNSSLSDQDVGKLGNPPAWGAGERRFKSDHPDFDEPRRRSLILAAGSDNYGGVDWSLVSSTVS